MSSQTKLWEKAAEVAIKRREAKEQPFREEIEDIISFIVGQDYSSAIKLLIATGEEIQVGWVEGVHGRDPGYFLTGNGFIMKYRKDAGEEISTEDLFVNTVHPTNTEVKAIAEGFRNLIKVKAMSFTDFVCGKLDEIASKYIE